MYIPAERNPYNYLRIARKYFRLHPERKNMFDKNR
jgi:hypothetical protein